MGAALESLGIPRSGGDVYQNTPLIPPGWRVLSGGIAVPPRVPVSGTVGSVSVPASGVSSVQSVLQLPPPQRHGTLWLFDLIGAAFQSSTGGVGAFPVALVAVDCLIENSGASNEICQIPVIPPTFGRVSGTVASGGAAQVSVNPGVYVSFDELQQLEMLAFGTNSPPYFLVLQATMTNGSTTTAATVTVRLDGFIRLIEGVENA